MRGGRCHGPAAAIALCLAGFAFGAPAAQLDYTYDQGRLGAIQHTEPDGTVTRVLEGRGPRGNLDTREMLTGTVTLGVSTTGPSTSPIQGHPAVFTVTLENTHPAFEAEGLGLSFTVDGAHRVVSIEAPPGGSCSVPALRCEFATLGPTDPPLTVTLTLAPQSAPGTPVTVTAHTHVARAPTALTTEAPHTVTPIASPHPGDADADGMTDTWESAHGLDPLYAPDASEDADRDNRTNLEEHQANTHPHFSEAVLAVVIKGLLGPLALWTPRLAPAVVGTPYRQHLRATGGTRPYTWSVTAGQLPPGLSLNPSTGELSGIPSLTQTQTLTVQVEDAHQRTATGVLTLTVAH